VVVSSPVVPSVVLLSVVLASLVEVSELSEVVEPVSGSVPVAPSVSASLVPVRPSLLLVGSTAPLPVGVAEAVLPVVAVVVVATPPVVPVVASTAGSPA